MGTIAEKLAYLKQTKEDIKNAIISKGVSVSSTTTFRDYAEKIKSIQVGIDTSGGTATTSDILSGKIAYSKGSKLVGTMTNNGTVTKTLTTNGSYYTIPKGYHSGTGKVTASMTNLTASNIKKGVTVGGVAGTYDPNTTTRTLTIEVPYTYSTAGDARCSPAGFSVIDNTGETYSNWAKIYTGNERFPAGTYNIPIKGELVFIPFKFYTGPYTAILSAVQNVSILGFVARVGSGYGEHEFYSFSDFKTGAYVVGGVGIVKITGDNPKLKVVRLAT